MELHSSIQARNSLRDCNQIDKNAKLMTQNYRQFY